MLRFRESRRDRPDVEGHGDAVLRLQPASSARPTSEERVSASTLRWDQAIVLADRGDRQRSYEMSLANARDDARIMDLPGCRKIGRRQYTSLRRFIEQYSHILNHLELVARISQVLQQFQQPPG